MFWLVFGLVLHYCYPWPGELPTTPRKLSKTAKCKCSVGHMIQHLALVLYLEAQSNKDHRRECKEIKKKKMMKICLKNSPDFLHHLHTYSNCKSINHGRTSDLKLFYITLCTTSNAPAATK